MVPSSINFPGGRALSFPSPEAQVYIGRRLALEAMNNVGNDLIAHTDWDKWVPSSLHKLSWERDEQNYRVIVWPTLGK